MTCNRYDNVITVVKGGPGDLALKMMSFYKLNTMSFVSTMTDFGAVKHIRMFPPSLAEVLQFHGGVGHVTKSGVVGYR